MKNWMTRDNLAIVIATFLIATLFNIDTLTLAAKRIRYENKIETLCKIEKQGAYKNLKNEEAAEALKGIPQKYWDTVLRGNNIDEVNERAECVKNAVDGLKNYPIKAVGFYQSGNALELVIYPFLIQSIILALSIVLVVRFVEKLKEKSAVASRLSQVLLVVATIIIFAFNTSIYTSMFDRIAEATFKTAMLTIAASILLRIKDWIANGK